MARTQLEVERKLDVDADFVLPDLTVVDGVASADAPVEHALEAVYHDTEDLRLIRARVTLRRRSGGADEGWHLKLPAGAGARREVHEPLGRATKAAPKALRELVLGITRGAPTAPVATLRTRRSATVVRDADGRALAEIADDTVRATVPAPGPGEPAEQLTWREVEVELAGGDADLTDGDALLEGLCDRLLAAGARPATAPSKVGRVLASRLGGGTVDRPEDGGGKRSRRRGQPTAERIVLAALEARLADLRDADLLIRTGQPDGVHDVRVACRRLRSILAAYRPVLDRTATDPLRAELRRLGEELSDARDGEVALAHLRELVAGQPPELVPGPVAARLQQTALREDAAGRVRARAALEDPRYLRLLDALHGLLADPPRAERAGHSAKTVLRDAQRRSTRRLARRIADARSAPPEAEGAALHEVRKAAKRVRYTGEVALGTLGRRTAALVDCAERVQDVLGEHRDSELTREWCLQLGRAAFAAGENPWAFGRLHALEEARAERARTAFRELEPALHPVLRRARKKG